MQWQCGPMDRLIWLAPRIVTILGIGFLSLFALDAFEGPAPWHQLLLGFLIHMVPSFVLIALLALAWRFERIGGSLFVGVGLLPLFLLSNPLWVNLILGGPFLLAGLLFWISALRRAGRSGKAVS